MAAASSFTRYRSRQRFEQNCLCANRWRIRPNLPLHVSQRGVCFMGLRLVSLLVIGALPRQPGSNAKRLSAPESRAILRSRVGPQTCPSTLPVSVSASPDGIEAKPTDDALNLGTGQTGVRLGALGSGPTCDYSLNAVKTRPAKVDDKLTTRRSVGAREASLRRKTEALQFACYREPNCPLPKRSGRCVRGRGVRLSVTRPRSFGKSTNITRRRFRHPGRSGTD